MTKELTRTTFQDNKVFVGQHELTNLCWTMIKVYRFKHGNRTPEVIIFPEVKKIGGVKIEFPKPKKSQKRKDTGSGNHSRAGRVSTSGQQDSLQSNAHGGTP